MPKLELRSTVRVTSAYLGPQAKFFYPRLVLSRPWREIKCDVTCRTQQKDSPSTQTSHLCVRLQYSLSLDKCVKARESVCLYQPVSALLKTEKTMGTRFETVENSRSSPPSGTYLVTVPHTVPLPLAEIFRLLCDKVLTLFDDSYMASLSTEPGCQVSRSLFSWVLESDWSDGT